MDPTLSKEQKIFKKNALKFSVWYAALRHTIIRVKFIRIRIKLVILFFHGINIVLISDYTIQYEWHLLEFL
jgi:hypothetical protein